MQMGMQVFFSESMDLVRETIPIPDPLSMFTLGLESRSDNILSAASRPASHFWWSMSAVGLVVALAFL